MLKVLEQMQKKGLKKHDLRKMGFNPNVLNKVLSGPLDHTRRVDTETINRLCALFECQPGDLMEWQKDE